MMTVEEKKAFVKHFYDLLQAQDYEAMRPYVHEDFTFYTQIDTPNKGIDGFISAEKKAFDAFPDFQFPVHYILVEDDIIMTYLTFSGTHTGGYYNGLAPSGNKVHVSIAMLLKMKDDKLYEFRAHYDRFDQLKQLGVDMEGLVSEYSKKKYGR